MVIVAIGGKYYFYFIDEKTKPQKNYVYHGGLKRKMNSWLIQISTRGWFFKAAGGLPNHKVWCSR